MTEPRIKSVCLASGGRFGPVAGPTVALIDLDDGTVRETLDPVDKALVYEVLRHQSARSSALLHLEGWCECPTADVCHRNLYDIINGAPRASPGESR